MRTFKTERRVSHGLGRVVASAFLATTALTASLFVAPAAAHAQAVRSYDIPAGPLAAALNRFVEASGVALVYDSALTNGLSSRGLKGSFGAAEALSRLLAGSGLTFRQTDPDSFTLERAPQSADGTISLGPVRIEGANEGFDEGVSEGTGSYASRAPVSTATPLGLTARETPQSISIITRQRMDDQRLTSISDVLAQAPGIVLGTLGSDRLTVNSRGYGVTTFQYDGVSTSVEYLGLNAVAPQTGADMATYDHVEVLRGAAGLMGGAGEPSGAVNLVRKKPTLDYQAVAEGSIGSWQDRRAMIDLSGPLIREGKLRARAVAVIDDGDSFIDNYGRNKKLLYGIVEADVTPTTLLALGVEFQRDHTKGASNYEGIPLWFSNGERTDFPRSFSLAGKDNYLKARSTNIFGSLEQSLGGDWKVTVKGTHLRSRQVQDTLFTQVDYALPDQDTGDGLTTYATLSRYGLKADGLDIRVNGTFELLGRKHEIVIGADYQDFSSTGRIFYDESGLIDMPINIYSWDRSGRGVYGDRSGYDWESSRTQKGLYAAARFTLADRLKLIAGTRLFEYRDRYTEAWPVDDSYSDVSSREKSVWTPYGGLVFGISSSHNAYASYTTIYQPQTIRDREGARLPPLKGSNIEIGIKSQWLEGLTTAVALYETRQDNLGQPDDGYFVPGTIDEQAYYAVNGARTRGIDVEIVGSPVPDWNISASWTYSRLEDSDGIRLNTTTPLHAVKFWTTYRLRGPLDGLTIGGGIDWQSRAYSTTYAWMIDKDFYYEQKAYALVNLMARYQVNERLSISTNLNNLFDKKYFSSVTDWWYSGFYGAPRNFAVTLQGKF